MITTEEKLQHFSQMVYNQAEKQRSELLQKTDEKAKLMLEEHESNCLSVAYKNIQKQIGQIQKSANEAISKFQLDSKKELLLKREAMVNEVFQNVIDKLAGFLASAEYPDFLINVIKDGIALLADGELVIFLDANDAKHLDMVKSIFPSMAVELLPADEDIIGGARIYSKTSLQIADMSIANRLKNERQAFLNNSGLILT